jgi:hypothetical protein
MARFKVPKNFGGFTHAGQSFKADKRGFITLPEDVPLDVAASHGIVLAEEAAADTAPEGGSEGGEGENNGAGA